MMWPYQRRAVKAQQFFFCQPYRDFFFPSFPTTPSLEKPKLMFEAALMCLNSHGPDTCNKKKLLKSETLDFVNMDVCPRYQVLTLGGKKKNCSNRREKGELLLSRGGFAAQMEQRGVGSVCLSSPHVFVWSLQKDILRKRKKRCLGEWRYQVATLNTHLWMYMHVKSINKSFYNESCQRCVALSPTFCLLFWKI